MMDKAALLFEDTLLESYQKDAPFEWAYAQGTLGHKFETFAYDGIDTAILVKSIDQLKKKVEGLCQEREEQDWAMAKSDLATLLHRLGRQDTSNVKLINDSIDTYKSLMTTWRALENPVEWSALFNSLGRVLQTQGERLSGARVLEQTLAVFNNALKVRMQDEVPQNWAMSQNNLGVSLQILGKRQQKSQMLKDSVVSYSNALQVVKQEEMPVAWTVIMGNLGATYKELAAQEKDKDIAKSAVDVFDSLANFFGDARHAKYLAMTEEQRNSADVVLRSL